MKDETIEKITEITQRIKKIDGAIHASSIHFDIQPFNHPILTGLVGKDATESIKTILLDDLKKQRAELVAKLSQALQ